MQHVEKWTRKHRVATLILLLLFLVTAGLVASQGRATTPVAEQAVDQPETPAQQVSAPVPQPAAVFIQRTSSAYGNVYVTVQLTPAEVSAKQADGTAEFITIGNPEAPVILRDDGGGGDAAAGDGIYTGLATVDDAQLTARSQADQSALSANGSAPVPVFSGRVAVGTATPSGFDLTGFNAGRSVRFDPAVVYLQPEGLGTGTGTGSGTVSGLAASHGLRNVSAAAVTLGTNHFQDSVLMIRDLTVVQDNARTYNPCTDGGNRSGVWTFNHLITEMANQRGSGLDPAQFAEDWLKTWTLSPGPTINGHTVSTRSAMQTLILNNWPRINGKLDLGHAPLRLLAIDPRIDLRTTTNGGGGYNANTSGNFLDAGEARFVFGFVTNANSAQCAPLPFSVIFEFRVHRCDCAGVRDWARQWTALDGLVRGSASYNAALQRITEQFVRANTNPARPNGSSIGQVRTNEIALGSIWELREFQLTQFAWSNLNESTANDTAIDSFNNTPTFLSWIRFHEANPNARVPLLFSGAPFQGSNPQVPFPPTSFFWSAPGLVGPGPDVDGRFNVSLNACNGCHARETNTSFTHVDPRTAINQPAILSGFLTGISQLADPVFPATKRDFDDLARREQDIKQVAGMTCFNFQPANIAAVRASIDATGHLPADIFGGAPPAPPELLVSVSVDDMKRNPVLQVH